MDSDTTIEILDFSYDLFEYLWARHKFNTPDLEKLFENQRNTKANRRTLEESEFNEHIGKAVLNSQYLLRDYSEHFFLTMDEQLLVSDISFNLGVCAVMLNYTRHSKTVFSRFIDSAAILAEAVLFYDSHSKFYNWLTDMPEIFSGYFLTTFCSEFFDLGGFERLNAEVIEQYSHLDLILEPFVSSVSQPYEKLDLNCALITNLRNSPIMFPIGLNYFCKNCELPSDITHLFYYDHAIFTLMEMFSDIEKSSDKSKRQKLLDLRKSYFASVHKAIECDSSNIGRNRGRFLCKFIGKCEGYNMRSIYWNWKELNWK